MSHFLERFSLGRCLLVQQGLGAQANQQVPQGHSSYRVDLKFQEKPQQVPVMSERKGEKDAENKLGPLTMLPTQAHAVHSLLLSPAPILF